MIFQSIKKHALTICLIVCLCIITLLMVVLIVSRQNTSLDQNKALSMADSINEHKSQPQSSQSLEQMIATETDTSEAGLAIPEKTLLPYVIHEAEAIDEHESDSNDGLIEYESYHVGVRTISIYGNGDIMDEYTALKFLREWENKGSTEDAMIELMDLYGAEQGGGKLYIIEPEYFVEEIDSWCFDRSRKIGDVEIIENPYGHSIVYFSKIIPETVLTSLDCYVSIEHNTEYYEKYNNNMWEFILGEYGEDCCEWFYIENTTEFDFDSGLGEIKTFRGISLGTSTEQDIIDAYGRDMEFDFNKTTDIFYQSITADADDLSDYAYLENTEKVFVYDCGGLFQIAMFIDSIGVVDCIAYLDGEWYAD